MAQFAWKAIDAEIPAKGKGYLILNERSRSRLEGALQEGAASLLAAGASEIFVTGRAVAPEDEQQLCLAEAYEMLWMERSLSGLFAPEGTLTLRPLRPGEGGAFLALYNECFFDVPNSATYTKNDLERLTRERCQAGFAVENDVIVGIYEVKPDGDAPEIHSIGLSKGRRGKGLGRELMLQLMELLKRQRFDRCKLMVSSANLPACRLYRSLAFQPVRVQTRWYRLRTEALADRMEAFPDV